MELRISTKWIFLFSFFLILSSLALTAETGAQAGRVGTSTCIACHRDWLDNDPSIEDEIFLPVDAGTYVPLNLVSSHTDLPFYTIPEGYVSSIHNTPSFNPLLRDEVTCEGCHGSGLAHYGVGFIPRPIPQADTCGLCHAPPFFEISEFLSTAHTNQSQDPGIYFDQPSNGTGQAQTSFPNLGETVSLFRSDQRTPVTMNERIEECSVCHSYALQYPQFQKKISQNNMPDPQVSCGACHDSHIVAPNGKQPATLNGPVQVTSVSGSTVRAVTPVERTASYLNHKPYKLAENGAQDTINGIWTRGSAISRPSTSLVAGVGTLSTSGTSNLLTFAGGGFQGNIKELNTLFISGTASATVNLPSEAVNAGAPVTVKATFDRFGLEVVEVLDDNTVVLGAAPTTTATVTYTKTEGGTGTISVPITFTGSINFDIRDMYTNTEALCGSCHTQGTHKFSAWGQKSDGTFADASKTHNIDIMSQYLLSGHGNKRAIPFEEFTAFGGHKILYPHDQRITGTGGVGSLRNRSNTSYELTQTPNPANAYLSAAGNTTLPLVTSTSFDCNQCHHGLGAVDFINSVQGTSNASVLWGDATVTCWTCHDPHANPEKNVRIPTNLSISAQFVSANNPRGTMNKFLDGADIQPEVGNGAICLFCHQGRESGLTVFLRFKAKSIDPYANPDAVLGSTTFPNPHYLDSGSLVWSRNMWEWFFNNAPQTYSTGVKAHQDLNCMGCHMAEANAANTEGGHTWKARIETCQQCHGTSIKNFTDVPASADYDGDGVVKTTFEEIGTVSADGKSGTGLFGQLVAALQAKGIFYNPDSRPYFFDAADVGWNKFTSKTLGAAFNLGLAWKSGNCVYYHNAPYIVQIFQDSLKALDVTPKGVRPPTPATGSRPATDYRVTQNNIPK